MTIQLPRLADNPFRVEGLSLTSLPDLPDDSPRPDADFAARLDPRRRQLTFELSGAEPNTTNRVFLATDLPDRPVTLPGLAGRAHITATNAARDAQGEAWTIDLVTDGTGRGLRTLPWPATRPAIRFAQAQSPRSLSRPARIFILPP